jgi:type IV pilus assembly protein PilW
MTLRAKLRSDCRPSHRSALGFSMVELLVGVVIALVGTVAIMQAFTQSEGLRRSTGNMADSQSNGLIGLFTIERDLQQAGMGFTNLRSMGCTISASAAPVSNMNGLALVPAAIIPAGVVAGSVDNVWNIPPGDSGSDMLVVAYGNSAGVLEGTPLTAATATSTFRLSNIMGISLNDYMLVGQSGLGCVLGPVTATVQATKDATLNVTAGNYGTSAYAFNLGQAPRFVAYAVRNGVLTVCDFMLANCTGSATDSTVWRPIVNDVVAIVAQYGWDTSAAADMAVDVFCKTRLTSGSVSCPSNDTGSPAAGNTGLTQAQRACDWSRAPSIRLALVTRSGQYEKDEVSPAYLTLWAQSTTTPITNGATFTVPDRHYRYRVAYTTVALRNVKWMGAQSTCL